MSSPFRDLGAPGNALRTAVRFVRLLSLRVRARGRLQVGSNVTFGAHADIRPAEYARFGNFVGVGKNFTCECNADVGSEVLISSNVSFIGNDHAFDDPASTVFRQGRLPAAEVRVCGNNLIGFGAIVLGGVTIGYGAIVGAGSVVTRDVEPYTVVAGVPARKVGLRFKKTGEGDA